MKIYAYPILGRGGLGNMLFPWARAEIFCRKTGAQMLAPEWTRVKIGPILRGEKDKRTYMNHFDNEGYIAGIKKWVRLIAGKAHDSKDVSGN